MHFAESRLQLSLQLGKQKLHSSKPQGLWRNPVFPSTCLCGVSMLETLSLISYRGRGSQSGQSLVEKYKFLSGIN